MDGSAENRTASRALLAFGGNLAHSGQLPQEILRRGADMLSARLDQPLVMSRLYATPAFPAGAGPDFVNAAAALDWHGSAVDLLALLHEIEAALGRTRRTRWEARIMAAHAPERQAGRKSLPEVTHITCGEGTRT